MKFNGMELTLASAHFKLWKVCLPLEKMKVNYIHLIESSATLISLWGEDNGDIEDKYYINQIFYVNKQLILFKIPLDKNNPQYHDISTIFPSANRMQRATTDLFGFQIVHPRDNRKWISHQKWDVNNPLLKGPGSNQVPDETLYSYSFHKVQGQGVHVIPVGPVHAGVIESGHFRFQVVGEKILRLEERLGYKHRGVEKRFEELHFVEAAKVAARISGDSTVAYSWAYAMAIESLAQIHVPPRALWIRALLLERERIMNHIGDLGAITNDTGFSFGLSQFSRLKEEMLRLNEALFSHRYLMDVIIPGGVKYDISDLDLIKINDEIHKIKPELHTLKQILDQHEGVQDRFCTTGILTHLQAQELEIYGLCARASGIHCDQRVHNPCYPYTELKVNECMKRQGDVWARVEVRFAEIFESIRLLHHIITHLKKHLGPVAVNLHTLPQNQEGFGWIEGFRGAVLVAVKSGENNRLSRVHPHDPSWQNWPGVELAVMGNIVPDFPLINKSFNLTYAGHDL